MDSERLKVLEAKYWEGATSSEEDRALMADAGRDDSVLSTELKQLLSAISEAQSVELGTEFDDAFWAKADKKKGTKSLLFQLGIPLRYAAAIVVAIGLGALLWLSLGEPTNSGPAGSEVLVVDTYEDPEQAFEETRKALMMVSNKMNKGAKPMGEIKRFHSAQMSIAGEKTYKNTEIKQYDETDQ